MIRISGVALLCISLRICSLFPFMVRLWIFCFFSCIFTSGIMSVLSCWVSQVPCLLQWLILWSLLDDLNCLPCLTLSGGWVHSWCCGHFLASMQPVGRTPWFDTIRPFNLLCDLFLASSFSVCAGVKVRFSTMPGWRASSPPLKVSSPGLYILSKSCLRFFSSVPGFSVLGFFFFHVSFIIFIFSS